MKHKNENEKSTLNWKERLRLIIEALITGAIIILLYVSVITIVQFIISHLPETIEETWPLEYLSNLDNEVIYMIAPFFIVLSLIFLIVFVYWRLKRRRRMYELQHIIDELQYIAKGNYTHRVKGNYSKDLAPVVDSIHVLVDSTVAAMEEERKSEQTKDELITNISHDIRTPLTSIIGYLSLIESEQYDSVEEARKYAHIAYTKAQQMTDLVEELFEYTQAAHHEVPLQLAAFDLVQMLEQVAADFEISANESGKTINVETEEESIFIKADSEKLVRVFNNLLSNAIKYGEGGDEILIKCKSIDYHAQITFSNNGKPLESNVGTRIFERFYREEKSRSQEVEGSGLGLAIAKEIVESHGGLIEVSTSDSWTHFKVSLPLRVRY